MNFYHSLINRLTLLSILYEFMMFELINELMLLVIKELIDIHI